MDVAAVSGRCARALSETVARADFVAPTWGRGRTRALVDSIEASDLRPIVFTPSTSPEPRVLDDPPLVSVILPVYNGSEYLFLTLDALRRQTFLDFELIVVDDASLDDSLAIARRLVADFPRARVVPLLRNTGKCGAVAVGLALATGTWVMEINADDVLEPDALARLWAPIRESPTVQCVFGDHRVIDGRGDPLPVATERWARSTGRRDLPVGWVSSARRRQLASGIVPAGVCALVRLDAIGPWPRYTNTHTDYWLAWRGVRGERVWFVGAPPLAHYREHVNGVTRSFHSRRKAWDRIRMDVAILREARPSEVPLIFARLGRHAVDVIAGAHLRDRLHRRWRMVGRSSSSAA